MLVNPPYISFQLPKGFMLSLHCIPLRKVELDRYRFRNTKILLGLEAWVHLDTIFRQSAPILPSAAARSSHVAPSVSINRPLAHAVAGGRHQISSHQLINQSFTLPHLYRPSIVTNNISNHTGHAKILSSKVDTSI